MSSLDRKAGAGANTNSVSNSVAQGLDETHDRITKELAEQYLAALARQLRDDPTAFGLRDTLQSAGARLVGTLESLRTGSATWFQPDGDSEQAREETFVRRFAEEVAGTGALVIDTVTRKSAVACAEELLRTPGPVRDAVREGKISGPVISNELFCLIFRIFFKEAVAQFITTIVAGKIQALFPLLHVIDPAGKIADWVGEQVTARIPDPCDYGEGLGEKPSLNQLAYGLVTESVERALGIPTGDFGTAAA